MFTLLTIHSFLLCFQFVHCQQFIASFIIAIIINYQVSVNMIASKITEVIVADR